MPLPPSSTCQVCGPRAGVSPNSLFKCSRCQAVLYCGRERQSEHFASHKSVCKRVMKMQDRMAEAAVKVRSATEDEWTPANAFKTHVGLFWEIQSSCPYMPPSWRLCCRDNLGFRDIIPTLMLLLGRYQEAYDFIKGFVTVGKDPKYDWGKEELPFLSVCATDMTEEIPEPMQNDRNVFFSSSLVYIKFMLAKAVKGAINAHELADRASLSAFVTESLGAFLEPNGRSSRSSTRSSRGRWTRR
ncbi:Zinc ion binding protein [Phytophthora cinnamomi]|uniref:Zinc ion binding protein n=1 Tax=Phytophthora cinnamomi TaxID=4785 RepID=UPI00355A88F5|nr:Zinc ion binding protein [Phytophthora cinnamomi]